MRTPWLAFWTTLLLTTLAAYSVLVVVVTIGGFRDMLTMFRRLGDQPPTDPDALPPEKR